MLTGWRGTMTPTLPRSPWQEVGRGVTEVIRNCLILATSVAQAAQFAVNGVLNAFLPLYGRAILGLTTAELGWLFGVQTVTTLAIRPFIGFLSDRAGRRSVIVTGLTVCAVAVSLISVSTSLAPSR